MKRTFDKIASSDFFLVIGTANYLKEISSLGRLAEQRKMAKALKKPVMLLVDCRLSEEQKGQLRDLYSEFDKVQEIEFDEDNLGAMDEKFIEALKELGIETR